MTVVAFIPARGGSTRVPRKNLQTVGSQSLLVRAIGSANSTLCRVVVSTDDMAIADVAHEHGAEIHTRPSKLASDTAQIEDAIVHWLQLRSLEQDDVIVLLQPTSPFRKPSTVRRCVEVLRQLECDSVLTATEDRHRAMFWGRRKAFFDGQGDIDGIWRANWDRPNERPRSQDIAPVLVENGCVYAFTVRHFRASLNRMGGREAAVPISRWEAFEIDTQEDLDVARAIAPALDTVEALHAAG